MSKLWRISTTWPHWGFRRKCSCLVYPSTVAKSRIEKNALTYAEIKVRFRPKRGQDEAGGYYFNGPDTIAKKVKLAKERGLSGVMIWEIGQDAKGKDSLLKEVALAKKE